MKKIILLFAAVILATTMTTVVVGAGMPSQPEVKKTVWLDQGWSDYDRKWFHHASQGTATFPIPFEWFVELQQPIKGLGGILGASKKFIDPEYLSSFGFIVDTDEKISRTEVSANGLPVGFAVTPNFRDPITEREYNAIGLTCAGCHTGQMTYQGTNIRIDGGPAVTDVTALATKLIIALAENGLDPIRHVEFKNAVIRRHLNQGSTKTRRELAAEFNQTRAALEKYLLDGIIIGIKNIKGSVTEGFTRLDALNRIGNTVFGPYHKDNVVPTDAPVNYPHIWSTSWFNWVQYDASIMQPMIRNAGESMGVAAGLSLEPGTHQFDSTVDIENLHRMEILLAGEKDPQQAKEFTGLKAPKWPEEILGEIDQKKAEAGSALYAQHCSGCHAPAIDKAEFWSDKYWQPIQGSEETYYVVKTVPLDKIGTDSAQANVLINRTVNIEGMDMSGSLCSDPYSTDKVDVTSTANTPFAFALGLTVQNVNQYYYEKNNIPAERQEVMNGNRPNCLQAPGAYKARPLNGIWATGPFLHNGSVASLYEMLVPAGQRNSTIYLGYRGFDPVKVGFVSTVADGLSSTKHLTKLVVSGPKAKKGNLNSGHEFNDGEGPGIIGPALSHDERMQLVEYLKTL